MFAYYKRCHEAHAHFPARGTEKFRGTWKATQHDGRRLSHEFMLLPTGRETLFCASVLLSRQPQVARFSFAAPDANLSCRWKKRDPRLQDHRGSVGISGREASPDRQGVLYVHDGRTSFSCWCAAISSQRNKVGKNPGKGELRPAHDEEIALWACCRVC
jgi:hypothetical protein